MECEEWAVLDTGWLLPALNSVHTEGAFLDDAHESPATSCSPALHSVGLVEIRVSVWWHCPAGYFLNVLVLPVQVVVLGRLLPVEVVDTIGTGDLTVPAADASVPVGCD